MYDIYTILYIYEGNTLARVFNMIMLVWSKEGKAYTTDEVTTLLENTGFGEVRIMTIFPFWTGVTARAVPK